MPRWKRFPVVLLDQATLVRPVTLETYLFTAGTLIVPRRCLQLLPEVGQFWKVGVVLYVCISLHFLTQLMQDRCVSEVTRHCGAHTYFCLLLRQPQTQRLSLVSSSQGFFIHIHEWEDRHTLLSCRIYLTVNNFTWQTASNGNNSKRKSVYSGNIEILLLIYVDK